MGYSSRTQGKPKSKRQTHPIWRGIGCLFMILTVMMSGAAAKLTVDYGLKNKWVIPYQLLQRPTLPSFIYKSAPLAALLGPIATWDNFYAYLVFALGYMLFIGGLLSFAYALVYQIAGPPRWGPQDVPPPKFSSRKSSR